jgi:flagellar biosynthesis protein FlhA
MTRREAAIQGRGFLSKMAIGTALIPEGAGLSVKGVVHALRRGDIALGIGVLLIITVLLLPMPAWLLDISLAFSITTAVLILMTGLFIREPLEFSAFPTVLLIATLMRLALNIASTRRILSHGHEGTDAAGAVIQAFGNFVMSGNFVIGAIVFGILVIVNFVVITKGSGRIAEVAARFTLDAMPGKQMAIDADLSAGLIDEKAARERRKHLEDEASFFGAMDGASKFVKGDAIAGLLITFINIIGGLIIGVAQQGMSFAEAGHSFTILTVGEGLVAQIPALIISIAAGLLVSKAGVAGAADQALMKQFSNYPRAIAMSAAVMGLMGFLPGIPLLPFAGLATLAAWLSYVITKRQTAEKAVAAEAARVQHDADTKVQDEPITAALKMDELRVEIGYGLLPLIDGKNGDDRLTDQIKALRRQIASDMGFIMPAVRLVDNMQLAAQDYLIKLKEVDSGRGRLIPGQFMVMNPTGARIDLPGTHTTEPTFGLPCTWVDAAYRDEAAFRGYTVVDTSTVLSTHLTEVMKANMAELLSYANVQTLLKELPKEQQKLVEDIVPSQITVSGIQRVLQMLLTERISIRDLPTILEGIAEVVGTTRNPLYVTEAVRTRLARQICAANQNGDGALALVSLSPQWEQAFAESLVGNNDDKHLAMAPSKLHEFITLVRERFEAAAKDGEIPVLLCSPGVRPYVRQIVERFRAQTSVLSQAEIHPRAKLKTVGVV